MPFTISHVTAVLPLRRKSRFLHWPSLVIGSMVPDLGYFLSVSDYFRVSAHTFSRSFSFCLPMGVLVLMVFLLLRRPLAMALPSPHREFLTDIIAPQRLQWILIFKVIISLLLGSWTHIIWDSFTHKSAWMIANVNFLMTPVFSTPKSTYRIFNLLQHLSTIFGLGVLIYAYHQWFSKKESRGWKQTRGVVPLISTLLIGLLGGLILGPKMPTDVTFWTVRVYSFGLAVRSGQIFALAFIGWALAIHCLRSKVAAR